MTRLQLATRDTFRSLGTRNYRLYFGAQAISVSGTWMQQIALAWLVLQLTGSGTMLGLATALQFVPILLGGPWAGVLADRVDKRRLLVLTQVLAGILAVALGVLVATDLVRLWMVLVMSFAFGCVVAVDKPARQTFVLEMTGPDDLTNAITLNTVVVNAARVIGPAIGGFLIAGVGIALCFLLNGLSYVAMLVALSLMRPDELFRGRRAARSPGQLREGLRYVWRTPELRIPLLLMVVVGCLAYEFQVSLPLLARYTYGGDATTYGYLSAAMGIGAVVGGLATARRTEASARSLVRSAFAFGAVLAGVALAPSLPLAMVALLLTGVASIRFVATANAALQLRAAPEMRGRVMALWTVAFLGTTPVGGPIVGWVGETVGPRWALGLGSLATLIAAAAAARALGRLRVEPAQPVSVDADAAVTLTAASQATPAVVAARLPARSAR